MYCKWNIKEKGNTQLEYVNIALKNSASVNCALVFETSTLKIWCLLQIHISLSDFL